MFRRKCGRSISFLTARVCGASLFFYIFFVIVVVPHSVPPSLDVLTTRGTGLAEYPERHNTTLARHSQLCQQDPPSESVYQSKIWSSSFDASLLESRALFPFILTRLKLQGHGLEVGIAQGVNSANLIRLWKPESWTMIDPVHSAALNDTINMLRVCETTVVDFKEGFSMDISIFNSLPDARYDFVYLDAAHTYSSVKEELEVYYGKVKPGGIFAGHDYCTNVTLSQRLLHNQAKPPKCGLYTGVATGGGMQKQSGAPVADMEGVVKAVLEWVQELHPDLKILFTAENFTRESLTEYGLNYDKVLTKTRNPSWWLRKP